MKKPLIFLLFTLLTIVALAQPPSANFTAVESSGCAPLVVSFQDQSTGGPTTWTWNFGNGSTSTLQNPSTTYFSPGTYTVTLTAGNAEGTNTLTRQAYITVFDKPAVNFMADQTTGCFPANITFTDISGAGSGTTNVGWQWDFGNGTQSNERSPRVRYTSEGNYTVSLKVTSDKGCFASHSKPAYIKIAGGVRANFSNSAPNRCQAPFPVSFNNTSTGPGTLTYSWNFGDGNTSTAQQPVHNYQAPGKYTVSLAATSNNGCSDTITKTDLVTIETFTTTFTATDEICVRSPAYFINTATPSPQGAVWQFGDGTQVTAINSEKVYSTPGVYTVKLINSYASCRDSATKRITVLPRPVSAFTASNTAQCKPPLSVDFKDASANAVRWQWNFGNGRTSTEQNPTQVYNDYGNYTVTLITTNSQGCTDTLVRPQFVKVVKPVISFPGLPQNGCVPFVTGFSANISAVDNITSYFWNFGDGTTSTATMPSYTYTEQGTYPVSLTITTSTGCTDSLVLPNAITVGRRPVIDFTALPNPVCAFGPVQFMGTASEADAWLWDFSGGASSTLQAPVHSFQDTGKFTVALTVTNNGCNETIRKENFIEVRPPIAKFTFEKNCVTPREYVFKDESIGAGTWTWTFGDGTTSTEQNPTHTFPEFGSFTVSLTVTNDTCSHTITKSVEVFQEPLSFEANVKEACKTRAIDFRALTNNAARIVSYEWLFGNGGSTTGPNVSNLFSTAGNFDVSLVTTDIYGCRDSVFQDDFIRINGPTAGFSATSNNGCKGLTAQFNDNSSTDGRNAITNRLWYYGDGHKAQETGTSTQHVYPDAGSYTVKLVITDAAGCKDSTQVNNLVNTSGPKAQFTVADTASCLGSSVLFTNLTNAGNFTSQWQFGDGTESTEKDPSHRYADTGSYTVSLVIKDALGCTDSLTKPQYVTIQKTIASFNVSDSIGGCVPYEVRFTNTSQFYTSSYWDFTNTSNTAVNPTNSYIETGDYPVTLVVTGRGGCVDSAKKTIQIYEASATQFSYTPLMGCRPLLLNAKVTSPANMTYSWDFGDGYLVTTKNKDTIHTYASYGSFLPKLIISDSGNCLLPFIGEDTVKVIGLSPAFRVSKQLLCDSGALQFIDSTLANENIVSYNWRFGDGGTSTDQNPVHQYSSPGNYTVSLIAQTASSCRDTLVIQNLVKVVQSPSITILGDSVFCRESTISHRGAFLHQDTSAVRWFWQFPDGGTSNSQAPPPQRYTKDGDFFLTAVAVNSSGCTDTATKQIKVNPLPQISLPPVITGVLGTPITIQPATYSPNVVSYTWTPATGLSCTDCPQPIASPKFNTTYQVLAIDNNGCRNTGTVLVNVLCSNANVFVPNTFSPNGDGSNDLFYVRGSGLARVKSLRIFNRLGEVVFQRQNFGVNDPAAGWDGTFRGGRLAPDTYIYQVDVFCDNNETIRFDGSIALIR